MGDTPKELIILLGPTATGKTGAAIELAKAWHTAVISADSRQCFREINIGAAKPTPTQLSQVQHYFINSHSIFDKVDAAIFAALAERWVSEIFERSDHAVMVGGTGMYIKAFCDGLDEIPAVDLQVRNQIREDYARFGMDWLRGEIQRVDPAFALLGEVQNPQRVMRALEVKQSTGQSILSFRTAPKKQHPFQIRMLGIELTKEELHRNINARVDQMMEHGLLAEASSLAPYRKLNALQTVGYSELFSYIDGAISLSQAVEDIKRNTRLYAKRQLTWFRNDPRVEWKQPGEIKKVMES